MKSFEDKNIQVRIATIASIVIFIVASTAYIIQAYSWMDNRVSSLEKQVSSLDGVWITLAEIKKDIQFIKESLKK